MSSTIDDLVMYRCSSCSRQFFSTEQDAICPCGARATLSECQDIQRTEHSVREEMAALRRTIFALVSAAGGRAEVSFADMERAHTSGATLECWYDHVRNRQVWRVHEARPGSDVVPTLQGMS